MIEPVEHWPKIEGGFASRRFDLGKYRAVLVTRMRSPGTAQYLYVMMVFRVSDKRLTLCVASEASPDASNGSHALGLFPGDRRVDLGASDDWADVERFTARALDAAREHLGVADEAVEDVPED
jgi:hypothetical protein